MAVEIKIEGLDDVIARLKAYPAALARGPIRKALFAPAKMVRDQVKAAVPVWKGSRYAGDRNHVPGLLRDSIGVFRDRHPDQVGATEHYIIGTRKQRKAYANTVRNRRYRRVGKKYSVSGAAFYVMFVEFGTTTTGLGRPGQAAKRPFTKTFEAQKNNVVTQYGQVLSTEVDNVTNKLARMSASQL